MQVSGIEGFQANASLITQQLNDAYLTFVDALELKDRVLQLIEQIVNDTVQLSVRKQTEKANVSTYRSNSGMILYCRQESILKDQMQIRE